MTEAPERPRSRGRVAGIVILVSLVVILVGGYFIADAVVRGVAQNEAASQIESRLPEGVAADVSVQLGGVSVIAQLLTGHLDEVTVSAPDLTIDGVLADVSVVGRNVPTDLEKPVGEVTGTITVDAANLNRLVQVPDATSAVQLGDQSLSYDTTVNFLGLDLGIRVEATPTAAGDEILLAPQNVSLTAGSADIDLSRLVSTVVGSDPIPVCVAQYLPPGVGVTGIDIAPEQATLTLEASDVVLTQEWATSTGSCG
ncbi:LmeA family phospholipid-binding protein [Compostimonas suwonensis]|uniref:DUF2993 family protein n=1 Tax=Compostimonas suwonensis TaxID=1048394 RepID=A0A2M9BUH8_9MICO|nr:DUF2993 domain-containing protein [Compostimonas suwonensis]PJJ61606.1 Protein of unknown function (DUF2993) [Compostimonas suwonensis]